MAQYLFCNGTISNEHLMMHNYIAEFVPKHLSGQKKQQKQTVELQEWSEPNSARIQKK